MSTNLEKIVTAQSEQIGQLTALIAQAFNNKSMEKPTENMLYFNHSHIEKGGDCSTVGNGQIANNSNLTKGDLEDMRLQKNVRRRKDGRYEWQKMIGGVWYREIDTCRDKLAEKIKLRKQEIEGILKKELAQQKQVNQKDKNKLVDLAWQWYKLYKEGQVESASTYYGIITNYISRLDKNIALYSKEDIQNFLNSIEGHRVQANCFNTLRNVFAEATEKGYVKKNVMLNLKRPKQTVNKGTWIDLAGQKKILDKILPLDHEEKVGEEILFYLMTGTRCEEALHTTINFDKCIAHINGTKTDNAPRYVELSRAYCDRIKDKWETMFKFGDHHYSRQVSLFLKSLGLSDKSCHNLRHTFSSNLYYLKVDDKKCQTMMGHASIMMTRDRYTTFDPTITPQDIINLYGNLYPFNPTAPKTTKNT